MTAPCTAAPAAALVWLALMAATPAGAVPVQHHFTLRWTSGELAGQTSSGRFAYDSTLAVPQAWWQAEALLSDLQLTLRDEHFDTHNANANYLAFDSNGGLKGVVIGNTCNWTTCWVDSGQRNSWWLNWQNLTGQPTGQAVVADGLGQLSWATMTLLPAVPEPPAAMLALIGLAVLARTRALATKQISRLARCLRR